MPVQPEDLDPAVAQPAAPAAVLWDMDGTLVDTEPLWFEAEYALAEQHGASWTEQDALLMVGRSLDESGNYIVRRMGLSLTPEQVMQALLTQMVHQITTRLAFRPGARELLADLRASGVPCGLVTMSYRRLVEPVLRQLPAGSFDVVVVGDEVEHGKPHPEPYLRAAAALGVDPAACVAIEDSPSGAASAEAAGTTVLVVPNLVDVPSGPRRVRVDSLAGLDVVGLVEASRSVTSW